MRNGSSATEAAPSSDADARTSRAPFLLGLVLTIAVVAVFVVGIALLSSGSPASTPVEVADSSLPTGTATADPVVDEPVETGETAESSTTAPAPSITEIGDTIIVVATTAPAATNQEASVPEQVNRSATDLFLTASLANTAKLTAYKTVTVQESGTLFGTWITTQVGDNNENSSEINAQYSEGRVVDSKVYELDAEGTWHLKPVTERNVNQNQGLAYYLDGIDPSQLVEIARDERFASYAVDCSNVEASETPNIASDICATNELSLTLAIDLDTNLLSSLRAEGSFETWPGRFQDGYLEVTFEQVDNRNPILAPAAVDTTRFECVADTVGATTYLEVAKLLDDNTSEQNQVAFNGCGFAIFPRGKDLVAD